MPSRRDKCRRPLRPVLLAALLAAAPAMAEVYRWTDSGGRIHYGSRPPPGVPARTVDVPASTPGLHDDSAERRERQRRLLEVYRYEREQRQAAETRAEQETQRRLQRCSRLQSQWRRLSFAGPVYIRRDDGGRDYLDEAQRAARLARLRPAYLDACGEAPPE